MNSKATKQTMEWPPLLNMSENRPWVDTTFRNVEKINAPYLNEMLQPVWVKDLGKAYIHDKSGNKYFIDSNGNFTRNERPLFRVDNRMFTKEDVTEEFVLYSAYDETDDHKASVVWNEEYNTFTISFDDNSYTTNKLFDDGSIIATRVRILGDKAVFVCYYDVDDYGYVFISVIDENSQTQFNKSAKWFRHTIRRSGTAEANWTQYSIVDADPIIQIAEVFQDTIGISLVSGKNKCLNTSRNGFITYLINNGTIKQLGDDIKATTGTSTTMVENVYNLQWAYYNSVTVTVSSKQCVSTDGVTFYEYNTAGVLGPELVLEDGVFPSPSGGQVTIDGTVYNLYTYPVYLASLRCQTNTDSPTYAYGVSVHRIDNNTWVSSPVNTTPEKSLTVSFYTPYSPNTPIVDVIVLIDQVKITWEENSHTHEKITFLNNDNKLFSRVTDSYTVTSTVQASWLTSPNVVLDNGKLYCLWCLSSLTSTYGSNWGNQSLTNGNIIQESGTISSLDWNNNVYTITPTEYTTVNSNYNVARSNSFGIGQNFVTTTVKLNNTSAITSAALASGGSENANCRYLEYNNSNCSDIRYYPGTFNDSSYNYYGDAVSQDPLKGGVEDQLIYTIQGYRNSVKTGSNFNLLYYVDSSNTLSLTGISYSKDSESMGTLLTPWMSIDESFYVVATSDFVIYRDKANRYYKVSIVEGVELLSILDDRYLVINTTSYWNCYDSQLNMKLHYATDFNDRVMFGQTAIPDANTVTAISSNKLTYSRVTAQGINPLYTVMPRIGITSCLFAPTTRSRVLLNAEKPFSSKVPESIDTQPVSIFYGGISDTTASYRFDLYPYGVYDKKINSKYVDTVYSFSEPYLSPNIFTKYVNGAGNNDIVVEGYDSGVLTYDNQQPFLNYKASSLNTSYGTGQVAFFVLQGQFYAVMNEKLYSVVYNNGTISAQDAIIDIRGLVFVGNNPQIAFFFSPSKRMFYSFTGDAILASIYNASKLHLPETLRYWYDEMTQTIYVAFQEGLLVFGQKNTYLFENWKNVTNVQISNDGVTHITDSGTTFDMVYYEKEGYEVLPLRVETCFYGLGADEYTAIDRWDIVLYNNNHKKETSWLKVKERSLTNITEESDETTFVITPEMYDKWSCSYLKPYVPKLQKGLGLRLEIETPLTVVRIVPHIMDMETAVTNKRNAVDTQKTVAKSTGEF